MLKKTEKGYYILEKFAQQKGLIHGFSTRKFGNLRAIKSLKENENIDRFLKAFNLKKENLILMEQIHGDRIKVVDEKDRGKVLLGIDGMVCAQKNIILGAKAYDCLQIFFYDKKKKIIGVAHAGWRGVFKKIGQKVVKKMKLLGCQTRDILIGVGPHIGPCCYTVSKKRAGKFKKEFGNLKGMIIKSGGKIYLDLTVPMAVQLMGESQAVRPHSRFSAKVKAGILRKNIDFGLNCTSCQNDEFFSFRKEGKNSAMLAIINMV